MKRTIVIILAALAALVAPAAAQAATRHYTTVIAMHPVAHHGCSQAPQRSTDSWVVTCGGGRGGYATWAFKIPSSATSWQMSSYWATQVAHTSYGRSWRAGGFWYQNIHVAAFSTVRFARVQWMWVTP